MSLRRLVSFSALDLFEQCERRFFHERVEGRRAPPNHYLAVGHAYHTALAAIWGAEGGYVTLTQIAVDQHQEELVSAGINTAPLVTEIADRLAALAAAGWWVNARPRSPEWVERRFTNRRTGFEGVIDLLSARTPITADGRLDGWADRPCVVDYKTITSDRRRSQRDVEQSDQLALYALEADVRDACIVEIPRDLSKPIKYRAVSYTDAALRNWRLFLESRRRTIMQRGKVKERYAMTHPSNYLCTARWCPFFRECYPFSVDTPTPQQ